MNSPLPLKAAWMKGRRASSISSVKDAGKLVWGTQLEKIPRKLPVFHGEIFPLGLIFPSDCDDLKKQLCAFAPINLSIIRR